MRDKRAVAEVECVDDDAWAVDTDAPTVTSEAEAEAALGRLINSTVAVVEEATIDAADDETAAARSTEVEDRG